MNVPLAKTLYWYPFVLGQRLIVYPEFLFSTRWEYFLALLQSDPFSFQTPAWNDVDERFAKELFPDGRRITKEPTSL